MSKLWASYHLTKMTNTKGLSSLSPDPLAWDCLTQEAVNPKESLNSLVDPVIERFPENVHKKKSQGIHTQFLSTSSSELFSRSLYLKKPVTTGPQTGFPILQKPPSLEVWLPPWVATVSYQPKTTVGVPVAGGKPLPFRPWFLFGSNLPQTLDPYVSQLESNISKLPLWQFWFYHSGLCNLHPKLCVFVVFWWFGIRKFSWISKHPGLDLLQSNRFFTIEPFHWWLVWERDHGFLKVYHHDEEGNHFIGTSLSSPNQVSATSTAAERLDVLEGLREVVALAVKQTYSRCLEIAEMPMHPFPQKRNQIQNRYSRFHMSFL